MNPIQNWSAHKAIALVVQFNNKLSEFISVVHLFPEKHIVQKLTDNYLKFCIKQETMYGDKK